MASLLSKKTKRSILEARLSVLSAVDTALAIHKPCERVDVNPGSPLAAKQIKKLKIQPRNEQKDTTVQAMHSCARVEELRWAPGFSGLNVYYPCKVLSTEAKLTLNLNTKAMLEVEGIIDKDLVCFFVGKQVYFSSVCDHDDLPFFVPGDVVYNINRAQPSNTKTQSRTVKRLLKQLPGVIAVFDSIYKRTASLTAAETLLLKVHDRHDAVDAELRRHVVAHVRLDALFATTKMVKLDASLFRHVGLGDTIILRGYPGRSEILGLLPREEGEDMYLEISLGSERRLLAHDALIQRVIPSFEVQEMLGDAFRADVEYVTLENAVSTFHFLLDMTLTKPSFIQRMQKFISMK